MAGYSIVNPLASIVSPVQQLPQMAPVVPDVIAAPVAPAVPRGLLSGLTEGDGIVGPALSSAGNKWLEGVSSIASLFKGSAIPPQDTEAAKAAKALAEAAKNNKALSTPAVKMSELPQLSMGQLKMLAPFMNKPVSVTDQNHSAYMNAVQTRYAQEYANAKGDSDKLTKAYDRLIQGMAPALGQGAQFVTMGGLNSQDGQ